MSIGKSIDSSTPGKVAIQLLVVSPQPRDHYCTRAANDIDSAPLDGLPVVRRHLRIQPHLARELGAKVGGSVTSGRCTTDADFIS
jgi:hypothetical protein